LQQQQRLEKVLPALENEIGLLGLVRLRRERQVWDGVVSDADAIASAAAAQPYPILAWSRMRSGGGARARSRKAADFSDEVMRANKVWSEIAGAISLSRRAATSSASAG